MKITIVTTVRNAAGTIRETLESVRSQVIPEGLSVEHVVVDGASDDGTVEIIREFADRTATEPLDRYELNWSSEPDRGLYDGINKGIARATGDVVGLLHSDDRLDGERVLCRVADEFARTPDVDALYGNIRFVDESGQTRRVCFARWWRPWMLQWGYMPPHPSVFIRRERYVEWGGYDPNRESYRIAADCELLIRYFRVRRMKARYMPVCTTAMRPGGLSTRGVGAVRALNREVVKANRANGYFCCLPMLVPKYAVKVWEVVLPRLGLLSFAP